jgi:hypothetical protein
MRKLRIAVVAVWIVGCLLGMAWLLSEVAPARADEPEVTAEAAVQTDKLVASDAGAERKFGWAISVDGDWLVVGTPEFTPNYTSPFAGSAYVFRRDADNPTRWNEVRKIVAPDGAPDDQFGYAVAISGDTIAVGAPEADVDNRSNAGAVYIFYRNVGGTNNWGLSKKLTAATFAVTDVYTGDEFGSAVALEADTLIVGANQDNNGAKSDQGAAYVMGRDEGGDDNWGAIKKIRASDGQKNDEFGISVSLSGATVVVGAWQEDAVDLNPEDNQGAAYVYNRDFGGPNAWGEVAKIVASDRTAGDSFGWSVAVNGDAAVVGARGSNVGGSADQGAAYVYYRDQGGSNAWGQVTKLVAADGQANDQFGYSVAVRGSTILVGARYADIGTQLNRGAAYTFERDEGGANNWGFVDKLLAQDGIGADLFGFAVATNGSQFFVGAPYANTGLEFNTGAVYVFVGNAKQVHLPIVSKQ